MRFTYRSLTCFFVFGGILVIGSQAGADKIKLKDGQEVSGTLIDDGENVAILVPRDEIVTVDGQPFQNPPAPPFMASDLAGVTHSVPDPKSKVTLLKFWASWCTFCRSDIPLMKDLFETYRGKGLRILAVSVDQDFEKLEALIRNEQLPYPVIPTVGKSISAKQAAIPSLYRYGGIPAYFLIDENGTIVKTFSGALHARRNALEDALKPLLATAERTR